MEAILFVAYQLQEKYLGKKSPFRLCKFGKAFSRVPGSLVRWAMRKLNVDEWVIGLTMTM